MDRNNVSLSNQEQSLSQIKGGLQRKELLANEFRGNLSNRGFRSLQTNGKDM